MLGFCGPNQLSCLRNSLSTETWCWRQVSRRFLPRMFLCSSRLAGLVAVRGSKMSPKSSFHPLSIWALATIRLKLWVDALLHLMPMSPTCKTMAHNSLIPECSKAMFPFKVHNWATATERLVQLYFYSDT
nr:hypothetical protein CFP56_13876 [Quercus suber]